MAIPTSFNYPPHLPILKQKDAFFTSFKNNPTTIVVADTGSGKSTQVPKFCLELLGEKASIAMVQPRRIGATSIASRISDELKQPLGSIVGYKIRFSERISKDTKLTIMTDGMLLAEIQNDPLLKKYNVIIIDEAHERSLNIDILLAYARQLLSKRNDLKVIIASATIDSKKFSDAFNNATIITADGKLYPITTIYREPVNSGEEALYQEILNIVQELMYESSTGDILIFMASEEEINYLASEIEKLSTKQKLIILPLYARLKSEEQKKVFEKFNERKIIISTNIAETTLTIDGVKFIIDSGRARISQYSNASRLQSLPISKISQASANQRQGRCGRLQDGVCYRLYSEADFNARPPYTLPEILRSNLAETILRILSLKIYNMESFPFIDKPSTALINEAYKTLFELKAINSLKHKHLTKDGHLMTKLPIDPRLSRILIQANYEGCLDDAIIVTSALSVQDIRSFDKNEIHKANLAYASYTDKTSDFTFFIKLFRVLHEQQAISSGQLKRFAKDNYLHLFRVKEWFLLYNQIKATFKDYGFHTSNSYNPSKQYQALHRSILSGYLNQFAIYQKIEKKHGTSKFSTAKIERSHYLLASNQKSYIFPSSSLVKQNYEIIFSALVIKTKELYLRLNARIELDWLKELASHLISYRHSLPHWSCKAGEALCMQKAYLQGLALDEGHLTSLKKYDKDRAFNLFIDEGLLSDEIDDTTLERFSFLSINRVSEAEAKEVEHKLRQGTIFIGKNALKKFYSQKLAGIYSYVELEQYLYKNNEQELIINKSDFFSQYIELDEEKYPSVYTQDDKNFQLEYQFNPNNSRDGVSIYIKPQDIFMLDLTALSWQPASLYQERILAIIKALPKEHRIKLQPMTSTALQISTNMPKNNTTSLFIALENFVAKNYNYLIRSQEWVEAEQKIESYLRLNYALLDNQSKISKASRNLDDLKSYKIESHNHIEIKNLSSSYVSCDLKNFPSKDLPLTEIININGKPLQEIYLAFSFNQANNQIDIKSFSSLLNAEINHVVGVRELIIKSYKKELNNLKESLIWPNEAMDFAYFNNKNSFIKVWWGSFLCRHLELNWRSVSDFNKLNARFIKELWEQCENEAKSTSEALKLYNKFRSLLANYKQKHNHLKERFEPLLNEANSYFDYSIKWPSEVVLSLPRYLKAVTLRLERLIASPVKDGERESSILPWQNKLTSVPYNNLLLIQKDTYKKGLFYLAELKVKTFASEIKSPYKVKKSDLEDILNQLIF